MNSDSIAGHPGPQGRAPLQSRAAVRRTALAAVVAISISACGGGGGSGPPSFSAPAPAPSPQPAPSPPPAPTPAPAPAPTPAPSPAPSPAAPVLSITPLPLAMHATVGMRTWPDGSTAAGGTGAAIDGVGCMPPQHIHVHAHVAIVREGALLAIPPNIGLAGCIYEMHTHGQSDVIHIETAVPRRVTLGQFFSVWGMPLSRDNVAGMTGLPVSVWINEGGQLVRHEGDPREVELGPRREVTIVLGTVPVELPSYRWDPSL